MHVFGGWEEENLPAPVRTHAYTGRTCILHTEKPQLGFEPRALLTVVPTTPPCSYAVYYADSNGSTRYLLSEKETQTFPAAVFISWLYILCLMSLKFSQMNCVIYFASVSI